MGLDLRGFKIAVIGGDQRDIYLMQELVKMGASVLKYSCRYNRR